MRRRRKRRNKRRSPRPAKVRRFNRHYPGGTLSEYRLCAGKQGKGQTFYSVTFGYRGETHKSEAQAAIISAIELYNVEIDRAELRDVFDMPAPVRPGIIVRGE